MHVSEIDALAQNEPAGHLFWAVDDPGQKFVTEHAILTVAFGQYEPKGHGEATDELVGQYCAREHGEGVVTPCAQYDPAGHTDIVLVVGQ